MDRARLAASTTRADGGACGRGRSVAPSGCLRSGRIVGCGRLVRPGPHGRPPGRCPRRCRRHGPGDLGDRSSVPGRWSHICTATVGQSTRCDVQFTQRLARRPHGTDPCPLPYPDRPPARSERSRCRLPPRPPATRRWRRRRPSRGTWRACGCAGRSPPTRRRWCPTGAPTSCGSPTTAGHASSSPVRTRTPTRPGWAPTPRSPRSGSARGRRPTCSACRSTGCGTSGPTWPSCGAARRPRHWPRPWRPPIAPSRLWPRRSHTG